MDECGDALEQRQRGNEQTWILSFEQGFVDLVPLGDNRLLDIERSKARDPRTAEALDYRGVESVAAVPDVVPEGAQPQGQDSTQPHDLDAVDHFGSGSAREPARDDRHRVALLGQELGPFPHPDISPGRAGMVAVSGHQEENPQCSGAPFASCGR